VSRQNTDQNAQVWNIGCEKSVKNARFFGLLDVGVSRGWMFANRNLFKLCS
jgi:hypothetical protein